MKWIVGLGNPGRRYEQSRHNAGYWVVDRFARDEGFEGERRKFDALFRQKRLSVGGESTKVFLVKPQTYMNASGRAVRDLLSYFGVPLGEPLEERLLVIHDDLDLPAGKMRFRAKGSSGGHRGIESVLSSLGHDRFSRLKIGIGRREGADEREYVLEAMGARAEELYRQVSELAARRVGVWLEEGIHSCMNRFNAAPAVTLEGEDRQEG